MRDRREFIRIVGALGLGLGLSRAIPAMSEPDPEPLFRISLAQWSLHRRLFGRAEPRLDNLDFAKTARGFGVEAVEYVNQFFKKQVRDAKYLAEMKRRADDEGVKSLLIMIDGEGDLGDPDEKRRTQAIENHKPWVDAALGLGCHSIRVNARSAGTWEEQRDRAADGLSRLTTYGAGKGLNVIVENHGGLSSNGAWLVEVMKRVDNPRCGTLPDFGNFQVSPDEMYDRYKGVQEMMPFAKAVSAKSHAFDDAGNESSTDYLKMLGIVVQAGYRGHVGIEYEGSELSEDEGIRKTKALLERVREALAPK